MFAKNVFKAFQRDTKLEYFIDGKLMPDYDTVGKFMDSGLCTYVEIKEQGLSINGNCITMRTSN